MYTIHADGQVLFDSLSEDVQSIALSPKLILDINKAGSLALVLPPGNALHGRLQKLKSTLTVEQDGAELFRGRVIETETDTWNQQRIYSEGEKAFLLDSLQAPYTYSGTVHGLFQKFVNNHNAQVEAEKQFAVGTITAVDSSQTTEVERTTYASTSSEMEDRLLNVYGGYLRTRTEGSTHYLDWVSQYGTENSQPIEFAVNLLDLNAKMDAGDVFTVLIPLGASQIGEDGEYTDPLTVASVNGGLNYIQDDAAVAMYGRIWKTRTWSYEDDPSQLIAKGREYLKTGIALETITLKAVDMHFADGNVQPIRIGDRVRILSNPHGLDQVMTCSQIEIDLINPENTEYTFGEKPRTLTENMVKAEEEVDELTGRGGGGRSVKEEIGDIIRWADIRADANEAQIELTAGELNKTNGNVSAVAIRMDGVEAEIDIAASRLDNVEGRTTSAEIAIDGMEATIDLHAQTIEDHGNSITSAEIAIDGANAAIALKADTTVTDALGTRVSSAEVAIDGLEGEIELKVSKDGVISSINQTAEEITINASKINLSGYVTASTFEAEIAAINNIFAGYSQAENLHVNGSITAQTAQFTNVSLINHSCEWKEVTLYKGGKVGINSTTSLTVYDYSGNPIGKVNGIPSGFNFSAYTDETIEYLGH